MGGLSSPLLTLKSSGPGQLITSVRKKGQKQTVCFHTHLSQLTKVELRSAH